MLAAGLACLALLSGRADADLLDTILGRTTEARDRAKDARDRATEAKNTAIQIRDRIEAGVQNLTDQVRTALSAAAQDVRDEIASRIVDEQEFELERCAEFRSQLIGFLTDLRSLSDAIDELTSPICFDAERERPLLDTLIALSERAPCRLMLPVFQGLPDFCVLDGLREDVEALRTIREILGSLDEADEADASQGDITTPSGGVDPGALLDAQRFAARLSAARFYLQHYDRLSAAKSRLQNRGTVLKLLAKAAASKAKSKEQEVTIGLHGYALLTVKPDVLGSLAGYLEGGSEAYASIAKFVQGKLDEANEVSAINLLLTNQSTIISLAQQNQGSQGAGAFMDMSTPLGCQTVAMTTVALLLFGLSRRSNAAGHG